MPTMAHSRHLQAHAGATDQRDENTLYYTGYLRPSGLTGSKAMTMVRMPSEHLRTTVTISILDSGG